MVWILPTYNRPKNCCQVVDTLFEHGVNSDGIVVLNGSKSALSYFGGVLLIMPNNWHLF